jgi:DNA-directed RNA polymerase subunit L
MTASLDTLIARVRAQFGHFPPGTITHIATDTPAQPASHAMILEWLGDGLILERVPAAWARAHYHTADPYPPPDVPPVEIVHAHIDERGVDFAMRHPIVPTMAEHLAEAFRNAGGVNYVTFEINHPEMGRLSLRMQRAEGETPETQARRLRRVVSRARISQQRRMGAIELHEWSRGVRRY